MPESTGRTCVFCGSTPVTKEHVWPQWLRSLPGPAAAMARTPTYEPHVVLRTTLQDDLRTAAIIAERRGRTVRTLDLTVKVVCARCNNGWMAQMEDAAGPVLTSLIQGEQHFVEELEAGLLAGWAAKTAAMFQFSDPAFRVVKPVHLRHLRDHQRPARGVHVWMMRLAGPEARLRLRHAGGVLGSVADLQAGKRTTKPNTGATFLGADSVGFLVHQSTSLGSGQLTPPEDLLMGVGRIWPDRQPIFWPLPAITDEQVTALAYWLEVRGLQGW